MSEQKTVLSFTSISGLTVLDRVSEEKTVLNFTSISGLTVLGTESEQKAALSFTSISGLTVLGTVLTTFSRAMSRHMDAATLFRLGWVSLAVLH